MLAFYFKSGASIWRKCTHRPTYHALVCASDSLRAHKLGYETKLKDPLLQCTYCTPTSYGYAAYRTRLEIGPGKAPEMCFMRTSAPQHQTLCSHKQNVGADGEETKCYLSSNSLTLRPVLKSWHLNQAPPELTSSLLQDSTLPNQTQRKKISFSS